MAAEMEAGQVLGGIACECPAWARCKRGSSHCGNTGNEAKPPPEAKLAWTEKARHRFKERVKEITSRNRGHRVQDLIGEPDRYVRGLLNYDKLSATYPEVLALSVWVRRRVRLYYGKQWNAGSGGPLSKQPGGWILRGRAGGKHPRTRRRHLLALGADPERVHMASRSRKGYWRMSQNEIVRYALNNRWLEEQGVPDMNA